MGYLDKWERSVNNRTEFTPAQSLHLVKRDQGRVENNRYNHNYLLIARCVLHLVHSFVEVTTLLLGIPGVAYLLSERFCQDPVEAFFGKQRYKGGRSSNPSVKEFLDNTISLRVQGSSALEPLRGNCKRKTLSPLTVDDTPLPKRRRKK